MGNGDPKIVMITGQDDMNYIQKCVESGALAYVIKPFKVRDVLNSIEFAASS